MIENDRFIQSVQDWWQHLIGDDEAYGLTDDEALARVQKALYKGTRCGMFVEVEERTEKGRISKLALGSIIEGSDEGTEIYIVGFPFSVKIVDGIIQDIEDEASWMWEEANLGEDGEYRMVILPEEAD